MPPRPSQDWRLREIKGVREIKREIKGVRNLFDTYSWGK
jgi:hypothetical protein